MSLALSDQYYLKAVEGYPYDLHDAIEALGYSISYDPEYAPAHCLIGKIYGYHLHNTTLANHHMELALLYDPSYLETYYSYLYLLILYGRYKKADQLMRQCVQCRDIHIVKILLLSALSHERRGNYYISKITLHRALKHSVCTKEIEYINGALPRIKKKLKFNKKLTF